MGVDLVDLARADRLVRNHPAGVERFLTPSEARLWGKARNKVIAFALIFAAKEAASKSVGQSLTGPAAFKDFIVSRNGSQLIVRWTRATLRNTRINLVPFAQKKLVGMLAYAYSPRPVPLIK